MCTHINYAVYKSSLSDPKGNAPKKSGLNGVGNALQQIAELPPYHPDRRRYEPEASRGFSQLLTGSLSAGMLQSGLLLIGWLAASLA